MLNERKLTPSEQSKREDIIQKLKKNKRELVKRYGKDAEKVMYGRATNLAKKQTESMDQDKLREMIKDALQNPKKADLNKDGKLSDYEKKRGAAIEKNMKKVDEMDINDPVMMKMRAAKMKTANAGDDGNDKFFAKNAVRLRKLKALKDKRAEIMSDMEQEAEIEGGPIADRYGDMLNKIDKAIAMLQGQGKGDEYMSKGEIERRAAMIGLEEAFLLDSDIEDIVNALGYSDIYRFFEDNPGAVDAIYDWVKTVPEYRDKLKDADLKEDLDLGHQDNEPNMLKKDLYHIGKYAMELYQMMVGLEGMGEVDFPHWWQSKIIKAKEMVSSAKHYLEFETKEPEIDAMVDVAQSVEAIDENADKWNKMNADEREEALLTVFKDPDDALKYIDFKWSDLPDIAISNLRLKEIKKEGLRGLMHSSSKEARARDTEESDREYIRTRQQREKEIAAKLAKQLKSK